MPAGLGAHLLAQACKRSARSPAKASQKREERLSKVRRVPREALQDEDQGKDQSAGSAASGQPPPQPQPDRDESIVDKMCRLFVQRDELIERRGQEGKARLAEAAAAFGIELGTVKARVAALEKQAAQGKQDQAKLASLEKKVGALERRLAAPPSAWTVRPAAAAAAGPDAPNPSAGHTRDSHRALHLTLHTGSQVSRLFRARAWLRKQRIVTCVSPSSTPRSRSRSAACCSPAPRCMRRCRRRWPAPMPAARCGAYSAAGHVMWLPHGSVVGDGFWTGAYAARVNEFKARAIVRAAGGRGDAAAAGGARTGGGAGVSGSGRALAAAAAGGT
jgi:hypothetical protein